jgi:hypothetical protein
VPVAQQQQQEQQTQPYQQQDRGWGTEQDLHHGHSKGQCAGQRGLMRCASSRLCHLVVVGSRQPQQLTGGCNSNITSVELHPAVAAQQHCAMAMCADLHKFNGVALPPTLARLAAGINALPGWLDCRVEPLGAWCNEAPLWGNPFLWQGLHGLPYRGVDWSRQGSHSCRVAVCLRLVTYSS